MGTTYRILVVDDRDQIKKEGLKREIEAVLDRINLSMSTYISNSEISKFNESRGLDWFPVTNAFMIVVKNSLAVSRESGGAFDVTIGPLIDLWGFGKEGEDRIPSADELEKVKALVGYQRLSVSEDPPALKKNSPRLRINLSAIAKGYGVDRVADWLTEKGLTHYLVEIGGEVRTSGLKHGNPWRIGIVTPDTFNKYHKIVQLTDLSLATSGDYFNYFEKDGKRYSHTIDPVAMKPIVHKLASVSVAHKSCMLADAYATAINVMGPVKGYQLALKLKLPIYMIIRKDNAFEVKLSPQFESLFIEELK